MEGRGGSGAQGRCRKDASCHLPIWQLCHHQPNGVPRCGKVGTGELEAWCSAAWCCHMQSVLTLGRGCAWDPSPYPTQQTPSCPSNSVHIMSTSAKASSQLSVCPGKNWHSYCPVRTSDLLLSFPNCPSWPHPVPAA